MSVHPSPVPSRSDACRHFSFASKKPESLIETSVSLRSRRELTTAGKFSGGATPPAGPFIRSESFIKRRQRQKRRLWRTSQLRFVREPQTFPVFMTRSKRRNDTPATSGGFYEIFIHLMIEDTITFYICFHIFRTRIMKFFSLFSFFLSRLECVSRG